MEDETKSKRKPYNDCAGYRASARTGKDKGWVVIYEADAQGIDVGGMRYAIVCETHSTLTGATSMPGARASMKAPCDWCEDCRQAEEVAS